MADDDHIRELERQVERGSLFAHSVLTEQAARLNESEAIVNGLVDLLVERGVVAAGELRTASESARRRMAQAGEAATVGVAIRIDPAESTPPVLVDCERRLPVCKAVCCRMRFALTAEEIEAGPLRWDLGRPYFNRRGDDGYCHRFDAAGPGCGIYPDRPSVCRNYSCAGDARIWTDFERMELNQEWIDANLGSDEPSPVEIYMDAHEPS